MNILKPKPLILGSQKGTPLIHIPPKTEDPITLKAKILARTSDSDQDNEKASQKTHDSSTRFDDSSSDHDSDKARENRRRLPKIQKVFTPKVTKKTPVDLPEEKTSTAWAAPIKKSNKNTNSQKPSTTKTAVIVSEDKATINHDREIQQKLERITGSNDFKQLIQYAEDHILERKDIPCYESATPVDLNDNQLMAIAEAKLICNVKNVNYFHRTEPVFGFPLLIKTNRHGQYTPSIVFSYISFDGLAKVLKEEIHQPSEEYQMKKMTTKKGIEYQYWLPLYINEEHYSTAKDYIKKVITRISSGKGELKEFHPRMVLEVLLPILYRAASQIAEDLSTIPYVMEVFSQVYVLMKRLLDAYPEFKSTIDSEIEAVIKGGDNLSAEETILKVLFSKYSIRDIDSIVFKDYLKKSVPQILNNGITSIKDTAPNFLSTVLSGLTKGSFMLVILRELVSLFSDKQADEDLEKMYGFLDESRIKILSSRIEAFAPKDTVDWEVFVESFGVKNSVKSLKDLTKIILYSI